MTPGIASMALLNQLSKKYQHVYPVYIQCGLRWEESELFWLKKFLRNNKLANIEHLEVLGQPLREIYQTHWSLTGVKVPDKDARPEDVHLPGRSMMMVAKSALYCFSKNIDTLAIGILKDNTFEDSNASFFKQCELIFTKSLRGAQIKILTPFFDKNREEITFSNKDLGLEHSFSCISPKGYQHCGDCYKCAKRKTAFARSGLTDRTHYHRKTLNFVS